MSGQGIRIIVHEPYELTRVNLFGKIIKQRGQSILIKLSESIKGSRFTSDLLEISPRYQNETFKRLEQYYAVTIGGALIDPVTNDTDYILIGTVTLD